ncbi:hypothetical protein DXG01_014516 [Tephrocybe rancida]|nr:hypothetical protein DXG01_014516 [Tephrocybe rancida]
MDVVGRPTLLSSHSSKRNSESSPSTSLSSVHIAQALQRSSDDGATLMFSKMNLSDVGVVAAEELASIGRDNPGDESPLKRITLGNNRLTMLPTEFALLSQLRYLNLKRNSFSVFPDVLTLLPSLDTLDISHNRIKKLPFQAGHLLRLRVFSLSRNKITRLPSYLSQFSDLEVLQVERNPIEWPPKVVMDKAGILESRQAMQDWVRGLQQWIEADNRVSRGDSGDSEQHDLNADMSAPPFIPSVTGTDFAYSEESYNSWKFPLSQKLSNGFSPHSRSLSGSSSFSTSSASESIQEIEIPSSLRGEVDRPPPLHLGILGSFSTENSPTRTLDSYMPSPADSDFFDESLEHQLHMRNASYSSGLHPSAYPNLSEKKSMPDLRTAKLNFSKKSTVLAESVSSTSATPEPSNHDLFPLSLPPRQGSDSSLNSNHATKVTPQETFQISPTRTISSMTFERNSYFQRLSTLPTSTTLPQPLLCLVESARSILFAMCQVYQTLEHFMAHAIDNRISSVLRKVLDPASTDMTQLIHSLERFDATSRKTLPSSVVCRGVLESCRDTVAVFGKAIGVLALQLQVIVTGDDVRYSRWILLELYGATAEVASAWETMAPHVEAIRPLLHPKPFAGQPPPLLTNSIGTEGYTASPTSMVPVPIDPFLPSLRSQPGLPGAPVNGGVRTARRHAGSFSSKDVEIGKKLPSYDDVPGLFGGVVSGTAKHIATLRAPKRQATIPITTISSPSPTTPASSLVLNSSLPSAIGDPPRPIHSRQDSQASFLTSASPSPSVPSKTNFLDLPSNSKSQVDKEALQAVQAAVDVAPAVWDMIEDLFGGTATTQPWIQDTIEKARVVTLRLSETLKAIHDADAFADRKELREDAHAFLKMVVQLSNVIKTYKGPQFVSSTLRTGMVKLTNSTEEFAILLHVSSFSPSTPRPYTPIMTALAGPDEIRLGSSLSRSKSAHHSGSFKLPVNAQDGPRSALPFQSFKLPAVRRLRSREGADSPIPDPG